ncbi:DUF1801 domain-containing protein [Flavobacterium sp.]|uniref:iron chaperone n=1 Tax=Flavobacterium sp. TaxID=239 RepID=UPI00286CD8F0|nr:DUF1801 domain-containing protein [Flavobacterium sp.]
MDKTDVTQSKNIDSYIASQPENTKAHLEILRRTIQKAAPKAEETISYGLPTFKQNGILVHFGGFKNHIGFYALPSGNLAFKKELNSYKQGKGSVQFPLDKLLPLDLITKIVLFRVQENLEKITIK